VRPEPGHGDWSVAAAVLLFAALAVLEPPDIVPWSEPVCVLVAAAGMLMLVFRSAHGAWNAGCSTGLAPGVLLLPFALASAGAATCRARAVDETAALFLLLIAAALGAALEGGGRDRRGAVLSLLAALGAVAALQAILQAHLKWPRQVEAMRGLDPTTNPLLARLLDGRPIGPFSLPAALGGFMVMALAASAGMLRARRGLARRVPFVIAAMLQCYALFLSRSFGALLALLAAVALVLPAVDRRVRRATLVAALLVALGGAVWFARVRRVEFASADRTDPLTLRVGNWEAALRMIGAHPILGIGPGAFGTYYPRTMRPGMNETRYAHNSYLQAVACWGMWLAVPIGALLAAVAGAARRAWREPDACGLAVLAGAGSFLAHNLVDFTAYLPGVAVPAAVLLGMAIGSPGPAAPAAVPPRSMDRRLWRGAALAAGVALALLLVTHAVASARARQALLLAQAAAVEGDTATAAARARDAIGARPSDPVPHQFLAELILAERLDDRRAEGERAAATALRLDPEAAILHHDRALYHHLAGEGAAAYREEYRAHRLYPLKPLYREGLRGAAGAPMAPPSRPDGAP